LIAKYRIIFLFPIFILFSLVIFFQKEINEINNTSNEVLESTQNDNSFIENFGQIEPFCSSFKNEAFTEQDYGYLSTIDIEIEEINKWYENIFSLFIENSDVISEKYKKRYDAKITLNLSDSNSCEINARVRINGDWKDHVKLVDGNPVSSLDVHLVDGNIFGITKFKLLIPETRNDKNEIFTSTLFSELGFLSPRTFFVQMNLNNKITTKYIFQEKFTKELVEFNNFREGPLIQTNDKTRWVVAGGDLNQPENLKPIHFGYINNETWLLRSRENFLIGNNGLYKFNRLISLYQGKSIYYPEVDVDSQLFAFDAALYATISNHMYNKINRKFLYDSFNQELIPAYYDGNSEILYDNNTLDVTVDKISYPIIAFGAKQILDKEQINTLDFRKELENRGLFLTIEETSKFLNKFYLNLKTISNISNISLKESLNNIYESRTFDSFNEYLDNTFSIYDEVILLNSDFDNILKCDINQSNCKVLNPDLNNLDNISDIKDIPFIPNSKSLNLIKKIYKIEPDIFLLVFDDPIVDVDTNLKKITVELANKNQKAVLYSINKSKLKDWEILVNGTYNLTIPKNNEFGLTGCFTVYNLELENLVFESNSLFCEDSINVINSNGTFLSVYIKNSLIDALDIDFSNIHIDSLDIYNSGNDCLDLSYGVYKINNLNLSECGDKGVSIGEASRVDMNNLLIKSSNIGLVTKDSSNVVLKNIKTIDTKVCFAFYRKKIEFIHPQVKIQNLDCQENIFFIQEGVRFEN